MRFNAAGTMRCICSLAGFALPVLLLTLSACGGGGGAGNLTYFPSLTGSGGGLTVSTFAGTTDPAADGVRAAARFNGPYSSVSDGINLYVADTGNNTIRRIAISTGAVSTLAGRAGVTGAADGFASSATFNAPAGIAMDSTHTNLYVVDSGNNKIRKVVIASGTVSSLTGPANTAVAPGVADGAGTAASFNHPRGVATDGTTLYVADTGNHKIRRVDISTGTVTSLTGTAGAASGAGAADGANFNATFNSPTGIAIDSTKTFLYVADTNNNKIRRVALSNGAVDSFTGAANSAGLAGDVEGPAASASFNLPAGIAADATNLYVADTNNNKIRQIVIGSGAVSSLTGVSGVAGTAGAADGAALSATFSSPSGIAVSGTSLFVADSANNVIRSIVSGQVSTLAGSAARFSSPKAVASDGTNLYVADSGSNTVRKIVIATGAETILAGQSGVAGAAEGSGALATFNRPGGITTDGTNLYVADTNNNKIRKVVISTGAVTSLTGASGAAAAAGATDGAAASAEFAAPAGIATDGTRLYVADSSNNKIRTVLISGGAVSSLTGAANTAVTAGAADGAALGASFSVPVGITIVGTNLYVVDAGNNKIRQVAIATGAVSSVTGVADIAVTAGAADGAGSAASFNQPRGITSDGTSLYVADTGNNKIRQIAISSGAVSSLTGVANTAAAAGHADGAPAAATFSGPFGILAAGTSLYVADTGNNAIRRIQ